MNFLYCDPTVFVINNEYEIGVPLNANGMVRIDIDGKIYYPESSGCLYTQKQILKVRVPQEVLDKAKKYTIIYNKTIDKLPYFSKMGEDEIASFEFKPITKKEGINVYYIADIHGAYEQGIKCAEFYKDDLDLLICNGDIIELNTIQDYLDVYAFIGKMSKGKFPVLNVRGNHDTRGTLSENYPDYFPANNKLTYFTFKVGPLSGLALDVGEDKTDDHIYDYHEPAYEGMSAYSGTNAFHPYRLQELEFIKNVKVDDGIKFAVSHIAPCYTTYEVNGPFDIEKEIYQEMMNELSNKGMNFLVSGHMHKAEYFEKGVKASIPVFIASHNKNGNFMGSAMTLYKDHIDIKLTDVNCNVIQELTFKY